MVMDIFFPSIIEFFLQTMFFIHFFDFKKVGGGRVRLAISVPACKSSGLGFESDSRQPAKNLYIEGII